MWISDCEAARVFYAGRAVLVTGADGFLGMNAARALRTLGATITAVSRRPSPRISAFADAIISGDLRDPDVARRAVANQSVILDFSGGASAARSLREPQRNIDEACLPHMNVLQACIERAPSAVVVFPSSRLVYGKPRYLPVDENHPIRPMSIYAAHKLTVEYYLDVFRQAKGLHSCVFRVSNPYGPYQRLENKSYGIINHFVRVAAQGDMIRIFGEGHQIRDYIFVDDLIGVLLLAASTPACYGETFNLGGAQPLSIRAAAETIARLAGGSRLVFEPWPEEHEAVETGDYVSDLSKLNQYLSLPRPTAFEEGVKQTLEYYRKEADSLNRTGVSRRERAPEPTEPAAGAAPPAMRATSSARRR